MLGILQSDPQGGCKGRYALGCHIGNRQVNFALLEPYKASELVSFVLPLCISILSHRSFWSLYVRSGSVMAT